MSDWISVDSPPVKNWEGYVLKDGFVVPAVYRPDCQFITFNRHMSHNFDDSKLVPNFSQDGITMYCNKPEPPETEAPEIFEGTREQLNNLGIRK